MKTTFLFFFFVQITTKRTWFRNMWYTTIINFHDINSKTLHLINAPSRQMDVLFRRWPHSTTPMLTIKVVQSLQPVIINLSIWPLIRDLTVYIESIAMQANISSNKKKNKEKSSKSQQAHIFKLINSKCANRTLPNGESTYFGIISAVSQEKLYTWQTIIGT